MTRTFHMKHFYSKFKQPTPTPNLLCIGSPTSGKSGVLNDIFAVNFETIDPHACGLWHDSIDFLFESEEVPMGFNVFDFHGKFANYDFKLIR